MEELDLTELLRYFLKKLPIVIIITTLSVILGTCYLLFLQTPLYRSSTTLILVQSGDEGKNNISETQTEITINQKLVSTYSALIKSRRVLKSVIDNLDLDLSIAQLTQKVSVSSVEETEIIKISVSDPDNKKAAKIANEIAKVFSKEIAKIYKMDNISIIDKAEIESAPYNVNVIKQEIIYFMVGFVLSCVILFIIFYFDTKIRTPEQIENKLSLTVLGNIPEVSKKAGDL